MNAFVTLAGCRRPCGSVQAERVKLSTTRSPIWSAVVAAVLSLGIAAIQPAATLSSDALPSERAAVGVVTFAVPVLMILAAMTVTGEYRTGMIRTTFMATPHRSRVLGAEALITAAFAGVFAAALVIASLLVAGALADGQIGARMSLTNAEGLAAGGRRGVVRRAGGGAGGRSRDAAAVCRRGDRRAAADAVRDRAAVRFAAPDRRARRPAEPFANAYAFTGVPWFGSFAPSWGPLASLSYFAGVVALIYAAAVFAINRRDP